LGLVAATIGAVLAIGGSAVLAFVVFDERWAYRLDVAAASIALVTALSAAASTLATRRTLRTSVRVLLG